jgi:gliding motility-associated lipoprotein GldH
MKKFTGLCLLLFWTGCDSSGIYHQFHRFESRCWSKDEMPEFTFVITDTAVAYNLYTNLRYDRDYLFSNLYFNWTLRDSSGTLQEKLTNAMLFDQKSGKPLGSSAIGFVFDEQVALLSNYRFGKPSTYTLRLEQFMRRDTLPGIRSVGLRVERSQP